VTDLDIAPADALEFERFAVTDDSSAAWAVDKIRERCTERQRLVDNHTEYLRVLAERHRADLAPIDDDLAYFEGLLFTYYRSLPDPPKTYKLPNGAIKTTAGRASTRVVEPDSFTSWALDNAPEALDYKPRVSALKDWPRDDDGNVIDPESGERVPGVETVVGETSFTVKVEGGPA
jgi:hypothetical protein